MDEKEGVLMEFTKQQMTITKGIAILFMLLLHLFCTKDYLGLFQPWIMIGDVPLVYYLALFGDCCVAIYCFCSGYGLMVGYRHNREGYHQRNLLRLVKLYINYWIIFVIFVVILGFIFNKVDFMLGNPKIVLLAFLGLDTEYYNGAWWFLTIYIFFVLLSPILNRLALKYPNWVIILCSLIIYVVAYVQRFKSLIVFDVELLDWMVSQLAYFGTSLFPFMVGAIFAKSQIYSQLVKMTKDLKYKNVLCLLIIVLMIIGHGLVQTLFVAPFIGIIFICIFNLMDKPKSLNQLLLFIGKHSTNLWLTHMFFYLVYFRQLVFFPKYPLLIYIWLVLLCLLASYVINALNQPISKWVDIQFKQKLSLKQKPSHKQRRVTE